jgi:hypothetical protein
MAEYSIEFNQNIKPFICDDCGEESLTVWGWVGRDGSAHSVYYAGLMTGHEDVSVRLTISIGGWGEPDNLLVRRWAFVEVRPTADSCEMMVRDPEESLYHVEALLGIAMSRTEVLESSLRDEFFAVADYIVFNDPAVKSYLVGAEVSTVGRKAIVPTG